MAERQGFEPWVPFGTSVFKTGAFDHSATSPGLSLRFTQTRMNELSLALFELGELYRCFFSIQERVESKLKHAF